MQKFKIGIDARMYRRSTGGIGRYIHGLLEALSKIDNKNLYYVFLTDDDLSEYKLPAKNFIPVRARFPHYSIGEQLGFLRLLNSYHLDLVHFTNFNHPIFYRGKFVVTIHDMTMTIFPAPGKQTEALSRFFYHLVLKRGLRRAKKIIAVSQNTKNDLINIIEVLKQKISVIYHGVDENYKPDHNQEKIIKLKTKYKISEPYILFVSQWRPHKGINNLVKAFEILDRRFRIKDLKLVITGKPNPRFPEIEKEINTSPLRDRIITPGFIDENDMVPLYSNASAFVFPSIYEGFGLNPLEAMACGTAVATSDISSIPEVCGKGALYFDPNDPEDIALKTHTLLTNNVLRQKLIERGFENVKRFSWKKMAKETLFIYKSALNN
ncbi:MAG: glycosyltransferase family 1 protein [Candidatus Berkelbacteria bacterium]|nr:glycosyltransferase family 1 protein [Candidatus Berkelbacteria bacterium]